MRTLETRSFVATPADVESVARQHITGMQVPATYLRMLIATTQSELGVEPRQRTAARIGKLDADTLTLHLTALDAVHDRFYTIVLRVAQESYKGARERNAATNFARTAVSTLRSWIRANHDIRDLAAARATKESLRRATPTRSRAGPRRTRGLVKRLQTMTTRLDELIANVPEDNRPEVRAAVEAAIQKLAAHLMAWGGPPAREPVVAAREHRPLKTRAGTFWVTQPAEAATAAASVQ